MERVVVEYWHDGGWVWSRDYPTKLKDDALEYGRKLWRDGVAGVRITQYVPKVLVEERRSQQRRGSAGTTAPRNPQDGTR